MNIPWGSSGVVKLCSLFRERPFNAFLCFMEAIIPALFDSRRIGFRACSSYPQSDLERFMSFTIGYSC